MKSWEVFFQRFDMLFKVESEPESDLSTHSLIEKICQSELKNFPRILAMRHFFSLKEVQFPRSVRAQTTIQHAIQEKIAIPRNMRKGHFFNRVASVGRDLAVGASCTMNTGNSYSDYDVSSNHKNILSLLSLSYGLIVFKELARYMISQSELLDNTESIDSSFYEGERNDILCYLKNLVAQSMRSGSLQTAGTLQNTAILEFLREYTEMKKMCAEYIGFDLIAAILASDHSEQSQSFSQVILNVLEDFAYLKTIEGDYKLDDTFNNRYIDFLLNAHIANAALSLQEALSEAMYRYCESHGVSIVDQDGSFIVAETLVSRKLAQSRSLVDMTTAEGSPCSDSMRARSESCSSIESRPSSGIGRIRQSSEILSNARFSILSSIKEKFRDDYTEPLQISSPGFDEEAILLSPKVLARSKSPIKKTRAQGIHPIASLINKYDELSAISMLATYPVSIEQLLGFLINRGGITELTDSRGLILRNQAPDVVKSIESFSFESWWGIFLALHKNHRLDWLQYIFKVVYAENWVHFNLDLAGIETQTGDTIYHLCVKENALLCFAWLIKNNTEPSIYLGYNRQGNSALGLFLENSQAYTILCREEDSSKFSSKVSMSSLISEALLEDAALITEAMTKAYIRDLSLIHI